jgi:hypothetical protein
MEKISGIIPASPRTSVADTAAAQPARPGAPLMGRPMGKNSLGDRITLSKAAAELRATAAAESAAADEAAAPVAASPKLGAQAPAAAPVQSGAPAGPQATATYKAPSEASKVKVVQDLNKKFFERPVEVDREGGATSASEEALNRYNQVKNLRPDLEAQ